MQFHPPSTITALYRITTPMFLGSGGADQEADAEVFRNASLKGALRFWWRALNWGRFYRQHGNNNDALKALHQAEGELFGTASDDNGKSQQSPVQISSQLNGCRVNEKGKGLSQHSYFLGLGLYHFRNGVLRSYLTEGELTLTLRCKPHVSTELQQQLAHALTALGLFGGLGSRARKGFGSLALQSLSVNGASQTMTDIASLNTFISTLDFSAPDTAPLSALTQGSRIDVSATGKDADSLLAQLGSEMHRYRDGTVGQNAREHNFSRDRELARQAAVGKPINELPKRATFGMPHNYFWKDDKAKLDIAPTEGRRASPLLIHIHQFPNGQCAAIQTLLPTLLPADIQVELKGRGKPNLLKAPTMDYQVIKTYLDRFKTRQELRHG